MNDNQLPKPSIPNQVSDQQQSGQGSGQATGQTANQSTNQSAQPNQAQAQPPQGASGNQYNQGGQENVLPPPSAMKTPQSGQPGQRQQQAPAQPQTAAQQQGSAAPAQQQQASQSQQSPQQQPQQPQQSQLNTPMPPKSLSALSSMTSTNLPEDSNKNPAEQEQQLQPQQSREGDIRAKGAVPQSPQSKTESESKKDNKKTPQKKQSTKDPKFAKVKKPIVKYVLFGGIGLVVLAIIGFAATRFLGGGDSTTTTTQGPDSGSGTNTGTGGRTTVPTEQTTIEYWGLWEPEGVMQEVIADFEDQNPGISVSYVQQSHRDYRQRLQTAIASANGPDIFRYHATWVPMLSDDLAPIPGSVMSTGEFRQTYYPVAAEQLQSGGQIVGIPAMYDGLALLYNKEIFTSVGEEPPQTWAELRTLANRLTVKSGNEITRAGIAMGTAGNVDHFSDILAVLMLQNGADLSQPNSAFTRDALIFYTNFVTEDEVWDERLPNSTVAFARGDVAMIFAPSWRIHEILAMNQEIDIGVAPLPLLGDEKVAWASYWAEGMSARSTNKEAAAKFLDHLTSEEVLRQFYSTASETRTFGEIYPQQSMASDLADDEYIAPYLQDAPEAEGWYLSSSTHDNGINDQLIKYYEDAVTAIVTGERSAEDVLSTLQQGTRQILRQYNVSTQ